MIFHDDFIRFKNYEKPMKNVYNNNITIQFSNHLESKQKRISSSALKPCISLYNTKNY